MFRFLRRKQELDLRDFTARQLAYMKQELAKPKLDAFRKIEPLFCELFWNREKGVEVDFVPEAYIRHLLLRRLKTSVDEALDDSTVLLEVTEFYRDVAGVGYVTSTSRHGAVRNESGYRLTKDGSVYLSKKFEPTPWYIRIIVLLAESWRVAIIALIAGIVTIFDFFHEVVPWLVQRFGH